jgi:Lrp/AsnC family leucine-responsive transcriptional regulator
MQRKLPPEELMKFLLQHQSKSLSSESGDYFTDTYVPPSVSAVIQQLENSAVVTQIYRTTGACHLHVHAVAASQEEMESFLKDVIDQLPGIEKITTNVILSRIKDVKGLRL